LQSFKKKNAAATPWEKFLRHLTIALGDFQSVFSLFAFFSFEMK
jgi:hypothetical protein